MFLRRKLTSLWLFLLCQLVNSLLYNGSCPVVEVEQNFKINYDIQNGNLTILYYLPTDRMAINFFSLPPVVNPQCIIVEIIEYFGGTSHNIGYQCPNEKISDFEFQITNTDKPYEIYHIEKFCSNYLNLNRSQWEISLVKSDNTNFLFYWGCMDYKNGSHAEGGIIYLVNAKVNMTVVEELIDLTFKENLKNASSTKAAYIKVNTTTDPNLVCNCLNSTCETYLD